MGSQSAGRTAGVQWLAFLGAMNLAIILLFGLAMAAVIGTVLRQNQAYPDYLIKFGPFWHEVFRDLGLYDVYTSSGFLVILAFLVASTGVCLWRNAPRMIKAVNQFHVGMPTASLRRLRHRSEWTSATACEPLAAAVAARLRGCNYRTRTRPGTDRTIIAAMRGESGRLGYVCTHAAIVIICLGGLIDGNLPLKLGTLLGRVEAETRDLPLADVPDSAWLPVDNGSFRASVTIPEGDTVRAAFVGMGAGYLVQPLPFAITLRDFRIEHYPTGQPKSFASDLVVTGPDLGIERTIEVNHQLKVGGYTLYQASFGDGGSRLSIRLRPLDSDADHMLAGTVNSTLPWPGHEDLRLELTDFRAFNVNPAAPAGADANVPDRRFQNAGPSFTFKLRRADGQAREYVNYMLPVTIGDRRVLLSGMRESPAEEFRYLHIPVDAGGGAERFLAFVRALRNPAIAATIAAAVIDGSVTTAATPDQRRNLEQAVYRLIDFFNSGGFDAVADFIATAVPAEHRDAAGDAYFKMLRLALFEIYRTLPVDDGTTVGDDRDLRFFDDAVAAATALPIYGSPAYLQLHGFEEVQASGLQITRAPGINIVYLGFTLLTVGVFLMFYVPHRQVWAVIERRANETRLLLAGRSIRHERDFDGEFANLLRVVGAIPGLARHGPGETKE